MRKRYGARMMAAAVAAVLLSGACSAPWSGESNEDEELSLPATTTVAGARDAAERQKEPEALTAYDGYATVRIATSAAVRVYVDTADGKETVVFVQPLNEKGGRVMDDWDAAGEEFTAFSAELAERMIRQGYVSDINAHLAVENEYIDTADAAGELEKEVTDAFTDVFAAHGIEVLFGSEEETIGE